MLPSKFANPMLHFRVRCAFFTLFLLAFSCSTDYYREYVIIDCLANWLVFPNTVTYLVILAFRTKTLIYYPCCKPYKHIHLVYFGEIGVIASDPEGHGFNSAGTSFFSLNLFYTLVLYGGHCKSNYKSTSPLQK